MIESDRNRISFERQLSSNHAYDFSRALHIAVNRKGYKDIHLDFSRAFPVFESFMVPSIALIREYKANGVDFTLDVPANNAAKNLFHNANWSFLINDTEFLPTTYEGDGHLPASTYTNSSEQTLVVDRIMSMLLKAIPLQRKQLSALEWSINEVTDNVLNHSESPLGGVIQASTMTVGGRQMVEFVVADAGIGIKTSLRETNDIRALERAVQEGVTRDATTNQGNGLYGTYRVSTLSNGKFELLSGRAILQADGNGRVHASRNTGAMYPGTIVICRIGCDDERLIENALQFKGITYQPGFDYIEKQFEVDDARALKLSMKDECKSFGSRDAGIGARNMIENLLRSEPDYPIIIDFADVSIISSSFADEVFGRLFVKLGPMAFMSRIIFRNAYSSVCAIMDRAIFQRVYQTYSAETVGASLDPDGA